MHQKELHIVRFSMVVLFSALMIVYLLLYQIKWDDIVNQLSRISQTNQENILYETGYSSENLKESSGTTISSLYEDTTLDEFDNENILLEDDIEIIETWDNNKSESLFNDSTTWVNNKTDKIIVLSWTSLWYWRVESVEKLWISYQYSLKDQKDIYYVFLDPQRYKFDEIVKSLGWTTHILSTEKDIIENKLFWDKVTFINLPEYKEQKVVMLVEIGKLLWLIQVDYTIYHNSKWYIKNLFIN